MESNDDNVVSDRDRSMMNRFEAMFDNSEDSKEKSEKKKKSKKKQTHVFTTEESKEDKKPSSKEAEKKDEPEKSVTDQPEADHEAQSAGDAEAEQQIEAAETYIEQREEQVSKQLETAETPPDEGEAVADLTLLQAIRERLAASREAPEEVIDNAYRSATEMLELPTVKLEEEAEQSLGSADDESEADFAQDELSEVRNQEVNDEDDESNPETTSPTSAQSNVSRASGPSATTTGGYSQPPLMPPNNRTSNAYPPVNPLAEPQAVSVASRQESATPRPETMHEQGRRSDALAGLIVGYLFGRRRGRLTTEARLEPKMHELKQDNEALRAKIIDKERLIRAQARERVEAEVPVKQQRTVERWRERVVHRAEESASSRERIEKKVVREVNKLAQVETDLPPPEPIQSKERPAFKDPEYLTLPEVLRQAEKIEVNHKSLRRIFETGMISEQGLRRAVERYVRGENLERTLKEYLNTEKVEMLSINSGSQSSQTPFTDLSKNLTQSSPRADTPMHREPKNNSVNLRIQNDKGTPFDLSRRQTSLTLPIVITFVTTIAVLWYLFT